MLNLVSDQPCEFMVHQMKPWTNAKRQHLFVCLFFIFIACLSRIIFWVTTHRVWEDALIATRHCENAAKGFGLTYYAGASPVQAFSSPLSVLIGTIGECIYQGFGIAFLKLISIFAAAATIYLAYTIAKHKYFDLSTPSLVLVLGYLALEHHQILWGMSGMETQIATLCLLFSIWCFLSSSKPFVLGVTLGLCLLARPDFIIWAAVVFILELRSALRSGAGKHLIQVVLGSVLIYGPWLAFATVYYGSPIPNTILAKSASCAPTLTQTNLIVRIAHQLQFAFKPMGLCFGGNGTGFDVIGPGWIIESIMVVCILAGLTAAVHRKLIPLLCIYAFLLSTLAYLVCLPVIFGWYLIPACTVLILVAGKGLDELLQFFVLSQRRVLVGAAFAGFVLISIVSTTPRLFIAERNIQKFVENGIRTKIGQFLLESTSPTSTVGCEALGYIGYYSHRQIFDYPGLANRDVVTFLQQHPEGRSTVKMVLHFMPDYVVLRPNEYQEIRHFDIVGSKMPAYAVTKVFRLAPELHDRLLFASHNIDLEFILMQRNGPAKNLD